MDDGLDPAFLDLDGLPARTSLPAAHLGAGFGTALSSLDLGADDPLAVHARALDLDLELELGDGFGRRRGVDELADLDATHDPSRSSASEDEDEGFRTPPPRRRAPAGGGGVGGLSLAAELASAARPQRQRDLMRELGLADDDDDDDAGMGADGSEEEAYSEDEDGVHPVPSLGAGFGRATPADADGSSPRRRASSLARPVRSRPSSPSPTSSVPNGAELGDPGADEASREEVDAALQDAAASLGRSMETTGAFLAHLRQHVTTEVDPQARASLPTAAHPAPSDAPEHTSRSPTPTPPPPIDYTDRQPVVEAHASTLVRRLYDLAKHREAQLRELADIERVLGRTEPGWQAVLADLEPLDFSDDDDRDYDETDDPVIDVPPVDGIDPHIPPRSTSPTFPAPARRTVLLRTRSTEQSTAALAQAHEDLADLRTVTTSLLAALASISDLTQVQSALASDAGRKLRALKAQAGTVRDDLGAAARCEAFVRAYEAREPALPAAAATVAVAVTAARVGAGGRHAARARCEVEAVRARLEEGWARAQSILAVRV
ncbi:hypothetical protein JCM3770_000557 [Rhodotorula araucariae]